MNLLIVEDEERNANKLVRLLQEIAPNSTIIGVIESISECVQWLNNNTAPDLIFMDVRLEDGLCFKIFEQVDITTPVIFTTSYDEYALKAFKVNSLDYLMKPIQEEDLRKALIKYKKIYNNALNDSIKNILVDIHKKESAFRSRFLIPYKDGFKTIKVDELDFIYSEQKITHLVLKDKSEFIVSQTMEELEEELNPSVFFRANRQHIVNVDSISSIHNYYNGKLKITLERAPKRELIVSREKAPNFKNWLNS